ncbi:MAG: ABC transporter ATP-binding protein [Chloroflexi bacterium]|nr:ABC transporter ATP-binding protein [Chloroflexota bacterium]MCY3715700.1 ABC transporter ATP-binding protein [Chloroflexota bacterium]MDE2649312.1 ABC transporter ATP-binding protein [Chloroflexota bacterium]MXV92747.1 ABC transporter ATP-binding protein [Chloroflexota bacterium]MXX50092.1 ABC transporter ATP-binding protein [Chloroflexota bacterium]
MSREPLIQIQDLNVEYRTVRGAVRAVENVSFELYENEVFGLAGESGCGKTTVANAMTRLLKPPAYITGGKLLFRDADILSLDAEQLRAFRWDQLAIVFQSAMNALNPVLTIGNQIIDAMQAHQAISHEEARAHAKRLLRTVGIDMARVDSYPHQLSGGMRQRAVIAIALALNPELIIMDEPTTALDVVVQKQILQEIKDLREQFGFSILFITHDLSLLVEISDRIGIMYAGKFVEAGPAHEIFRDPKHPYTNRLMNSFPTVHGPRRELLGIPGAPPDLIEPPAGCRFHPRCDVAIAGECDRIVPPLIRIGGQRDVACHLVKAEEAVS